MKSIATLAALLLIATPAAAEDATLYRGGTIITMDGDSPHMVEAVVAKDGRIAFAGDEKAARTAAGKDAAIHDLKGATMLPGFVDAHSHFAVAMQMADGLDLWDNALPPVTDIPSLQSVIRDYISRKAIPKDGWVMSSNERVGVSFEQPRTYDERVKAAQQCTSKLKFPFPVLVDTLDDAVGAKFSGMPSRLYLIDSHGKIAYKNGRGPFGFKPAELEASLLWLLNEPDSSVAQKR